MQNSNCNLLQKGATHSLKIAAVRNLQRETELKGHNWSKMR